MPQSPQASSSGGSLSPSPSEDSPPFGINPLPSASSSMVPAPINLSRPQSRTTPQRSAIDLPRMQGTSRGGCWTCRLRRKKCDEERDGDSCKTCRRLDIVCLGWGQKRPEWMRDKQAVESYKASIKAQLMRAGMIRGQPRASMLQAQNDPSSMTRPSAHSRPRAAAHHRLSAPTLETSSTSTSPSPRLGLEELDPVIGYHNQYPDHSSGHLTPGVAGASHPAFHHLPGASYSDSNLHTLNFNDSSLFQLSPQSNYSLSARDSVDYESAQMPQLSAANGGEFDFDVQAPSPGGDSLQLPGQETIQQHVIYYFEHVKHFHFVFGENAVTNMTYSVITQDPSGSLTNAVCALAALYYSQVQQNSQGYQPPNGSAENETSKAFHDKAYVQLMNAKQSGGYKESDVLAAFHLVCYSQMAGGVTDWRQSMVVALDWLGNLGLTTEENPLEIYRSMEPNVQIVVKIAMWMDIFSSITHLRPPRYFDMHKRMFNGQSLWDDGLDMGSLTGCPDACMLAIAEVSALGNWKAAEQRKASLSVPELIRRGIDIEQRLRQHFTEPQAFTSATLHPKIPQEGGLGASDDVRRLFARIFFESALLYLHTTLSGTNPNVAEVQSSVESIIKYLGQLPPSEYDRALVFPIAIAAAQTDIPYKRDFLKSRLVEDCRGNMLRARLLIEMIWQHRDVYGGPVDWRELNRERRLNLLVL